jgi:hypothetical protein
MSGTRLNRAGSWTFLGKLIKSNSRLIMRGPTDHRIGVDD